MRVALLAVYVAGSSVAALVGLFIAAGRCDEGCGGVSSQAWRNDPEAWQWTALGVVSVVGLALAVAVVLLAARRARRGATACLALQLGVLCAWLALVVADWSHAAGLVALALVVMAAGFLGVALTPARAD